jgi:hypothetical protein
MAIVRFDPQGPAHAYQTYAIRQRPDLVIPAACADADPPCEAWANGWDSPLDELDPVQAEMARWLRSGGSGRVYREMGRDDAGRTVFRFEAHQRCFTDHGTIPRKLLVVHGDWRRNFGVVRRHTSAASWMEDTIENADRVWSRVANRA